MTLFIRGRIVNSSPVLTYVESAHVPFLTNWKERPTEIEPVHNKLQAVKRSQEKVKEQTQNTG